MCVVKTGADFERYIESIVNRRLAQLLGIDPNEIDDADEREIREAARERAAKLRAKAVRP